jgi:uncharacterized protein (TIGR02265 family)
MYVNGLYQTLTMMGCEIVDQEKITAFRDYPLQDYMELLLDGAISLYPKSSVNQGLRELGQLGIPMFAKSIVGGVIMGTVGKSWELALKCVSRGYEVSLKPGKAVVAEMSSNRALVQLRNVWNFGETYQVGMIEGLMQWCDLNGTVTAEAKTACDVDLKIEWDSLKVSRGNPLKTGARGSNRAEAAR